MSSMIIFLVALFWFLPAWLIAEYVGKKKTLGFGPTLAICLFVGPILGLIIAFLSRDIDPAEQNQLSFGQFTSKPSVAEELHKLYDLKTKGAITEREYENQKARLLS
jgi:hypothetical protein